MVLLGEILRLTGSSIDLTQSIAFGVVLGPHVSFGGGVAALAYASKRGYHQATSFPYHPAKEVVTGLGSKWDVLVVGGVFGILGFLIKQAVAAVSIPADPVASGVVVSAFIHRAVMGYRIMGIPRFDSESDTGHPVETWLPYQTDWLDISVLGVSFGMIGGYLTYLTTSAFMGFGLSTAMLIFLCAGVKRIPVTHHITLPAGTAVLAYSGVQSFSVDPVKLQQQMDLSTVLYLGAGFGFAGAISGEICQRLFYARAETHLDPPAASIVVTSFLITLCSFLGFLATSSWIPAL